MSAQPVSITNEPELELWLSSYEGEQSPFELRLLY